MRTNDFETAIFGFIFIALIIGLCCWNVSCRRNALERVVGHPVSILDTVLVTK